MRGEMPEEVETGVKAREIGRKPAAAGGRTGNRGHIWGMGWRRGKGGAALGAVCAAALAWAAQAQTPSFTLMGVPEGFLESVARGVSADGNSAAGFTSGIGQPGFLWTRSGGRNDFGMDGLGFRSVGQGISGDGRFVVGGGVGLSPENSRAFRWSQAGGFEDVGVLPGFAQASAIGANDDGSIVVGTCLTAGGFPTGFRWTATGGMQPIGTATYLRAISRDGSTIIGNQGTATDGFVWTQSGGLQLLPPLGGVGHAAAGGVNFDGSIVVGSTDTIPSRPTIWVNRVPTEMLWGGAGTGSFLGLGVSDDGSVVVGEAQSGHSNFAAVWTLSTGIMPLADYLVMNGVAVPAGVRFDTCMGISADGLTFIGDAAGGAIGRQGFVATIPAPGAVAILAAALFNARRRRRR